ncbi:unnamed protein product [Arabis nemorensis]|uniref:Sm protein G n=1 Tax=Arabis nemorensis TaxID=586526 RepID=A0A565AUX6_9BRAS|nr:unnamed protein product [Arabis nemorensis]
MRLRLSGQPPNLKKYMDDKLQIKLNANRMVVGTPCGFDQFMNHVVDNTVEVNGNNKTDIGMMFLGCTGSDGEMVSVKSLKSNKAVSSGDPHDALSDVNLQVKLNDTRHAWK